MVYVGTAWAVGLAAAALFKSVLAVLATVLVIAFLFKTIFRFNLKSIIFMLIAFGLAFSCYNTYDRLIYKEIINYNEQEISYSGTVTDFNDYSEDKSVYHLKGKINGLKNAGIILYSDTLNCEIGDNLKFKCIAKTPKNNYLFNSNDYYKSKGIYLQADSPENIEIINNNGFSLQKSLFDFREKVCSLIDSNISSYESGMMKGMLFGDKTDLEQSDMTMLYRVGIGHVTAVSGLHLVLFGTLISFVLKRLKTSKVFEFILTEIFMVLFAVCCGMSPSIMRAFVMMTLINSAPLFFRRTDPLNSICIAIVLLTISNPFIILNQSFLLSVSGALGAGVFGPYMTRSMKGNKFKKDILYLLCVSIAVTPMSVICFGELSIISPITNLVITPICMAALFLIMIGSLLIFLKPVILFKISGVICHIVLRTSELIGKNKFTHTKFSGEFVSFIIVLLFIFCITTYFIFKSRTHNAIAVIISVVFLFSSCTAYNIADNKMLKIALLGNKEVGVIVITKGYRADVIDVTGKYKNCRYVKKYLDDVGITEINSILITNKPYSASSAYNSGLNLFDVKNIVLPENTYVRKGTALCGCSPKYSDYSNWIADYELYSIEIKDDCINVRYGDFNFECTDGKYGDKTYKSNIVLYADSNEILNFRRLEDG